MVRRVGGCGRRERQRVDFRGKRGDEQIEPQNADLIIFEQTKKIVATNYKIKLISFKAFDGSFDCKSVFRDNSEQVTSYESFPSTPGCDFINENAFSRSSQCALTAVCMNSLLLLSHLLLSFSLSLFSFAATCISSTYTYLEELMKCHLRICLFKVFSCLCMRSTELNVWTNNSFSVKSVSIGFRRNEIRDQSIPRILILFVQGGAVCA